MLNQSSVVARKEITDSLRDARSVISSLLFALMGPLVVGLVSLAPGVKGSSGSPLVGLMSVFTLVAAFAGGMNVAMDTVAGERERQSLLPLLLNAVHRRSVVVSVFDRGLDAQSAGILSRLRNVGNAHERALAAPLARDSTWGLSPAALGRLDPIVAVNRLPLSEGSSDLSFDGRVSSDGHRDVSRVLPSGATSLVQLPAVGRTTTTSPTFDGQ